MNTQSQTGNLPTHIVHQSPNDLVLALLDSTLPIPLTTFVYDSLTINKWRFEFHIIGESHLVNVLYDENVLSRELLACVPLAPHDCLIYHSFSDLQNFEFSDSRQTVSVHFVTLPLSSEALDTYLHSLPSPSLELQFPMIDTCVPLTRIWWEHDDNTITWHTLHTYPITDICLAVRSKSHFRLFTTGL